MLSDSETFEQLPQIGSQCIGAEKRFKSSIDLYVLLLLPLTVDQKSPGSCKDQLYLHFILHTITKYATVSPPQMRHLMLPVPCLRNVRRRPHTPFQDLSRIVLRISSNSVLVQMTDPRS